MIEIQHEDTWTVGTLRDYLDELEGYGYGNAPIQIDVPAGTEDGETTASFTVESTIEHVGPSTHNEKHIRRSVRIVLGGA